MGDPAILARVLFIDLTRAEDSRSSWLISSLRERLRDRLLVIADDTAIPPDAAGPNPPSALLVIVGQHGFGSIDPSHDQRDTPSPLIAALSIAGVIPIVVVVGDKEMPSEPEWPAGAERLSACRVCRVAGDAAQIDELLVTIDQEIELAQLMAGARAALERGDYTVAVDLLDTVLTHNPDRLDATELRDVARLNAEAAQQRAARAARRDDRDGSDSAPMIIRPAVDENVQFTVFRRSSVQPERWYPLLVFAHLSERRTDAGPDEPDPIAEMHAQASQVLGDALDDFRTSTEDSGQPVPRDGELRFVPRMDGVTFNPPERRFLWTESVHREEFRIRADASLNGRTARGTVTVFLGNLVLADIQVSIKVRAQAVDDDTEQTHARPYRRIFASYSHRDRGIVEEFEAHAAAIGDRYLRDQVSLRAGEMWDQRLRDLIRQADVFQLFWSWNALTSLLVHQEWQHALSLNRPNFVRPVYWEEPLPERSGLPPAHLRRLHFQRIYPRAGAGATQAPAVVAGGSSSSDAVAAAQPNPSAAAPRTDPAPRGGPLAMPEAPLRHSAPLVRIARYGSLAAVCVLAVGLYWIVARESALTPVTVQAPPPSGTPASTPTTETSANAPSSAAPPPVAPAADPAPPPPPPPVSGRRSSAPKFDPPASSIPRPPVVQPPAVVPVGPAPEASPPSAPAQPTAEPSAPKGETKKKGGFGLGGLSNAKQRDSAQASASAGTRSAEPGASTIEEAIREYERAWTTLDRKALQRIWPGIPAEQLRAVDQGFASVSSFSVSVRTLDVAMTGDTRAIVQVEETRSGVLKNGEKIPQSTSKRVFHLEKSGERWMIIAIAGPAR